MNTVQISAALAASSLMLSGCYPFVGQSRKDKSTCVDMQFILFAPISDEGFFGCHYAPPKQAFPAPESAKRITYTEAQRLQMADTAARLLFPPARMHAAWSARAAEIFTNRLYAKSASYLNCNEMATRKALAAHLYANYSLPMDQLYQGIAAKWSEYYSDAQLAAILAKAQNAPHMDDKTLARYLSALQDDAQPSLQTASQQAIYTILLSFTEAHKAALTDTANAYHAEITGSGMFKTERCREDYVSAPDPVRGYPLLEITPRKVN